jgi:hypothetical protein
LQSFLGLQLHLLLTSFDVAGLLAVLMRQTLTFCAGWLLAAAAAADGYDLLLALLVHGW